MPLRWLAETQSEPAAVDGQILLREEGRIRFVLSGGKGVAFPVGQEVFTAAGKGQNQLIALLDVNRRAGAVGDRSVLQDQPDRVAFVLPSRSDRPRGCLKRGKLPRPAP